MRMRIATEVADALADGRAVVALESTLLAHGIPPERNRLLGTRLADAVRAAGAVPATVAVLDGTALIGLSGAELDRVCDPAAGLAKLSDRDLGPAVATGASGATTVAATSTLAAAAGISVFGTGGLGGVHRGAHPGQVWDVSADLGVLARTPLVVVCSGVKSILDVPATLEALETGSIPVLGYRTGVLPLFYLRRSEHPVAWRVDSPEQAAAAAAAHFRAGPRRSGLLVANPIPADAELDAALHERLLDGALRLLAERDVRGGDVTPAMLAHFHTASEGASLVANEALVLDNVALAARIAIALTALEAG